MNSNLEKKLMEEFPYLYKDMYGPKDKTCMHYGITCGDGWFDIIYNLSSKLESMIISYINSEKFTKENLPRAAQVKEKFGLLRMYLENGTDEMYKLIHIAEEDTGKICEECGKPGKLRSGYWIRTLCDNCISNKDKK